MQIRDLNPWLTTLNSNLGKFCGKLDKNDTNNLKISNVYLKVHNGNEVLVKEKSLFEKFKASVSTTFMGKWLVNNRVMDDFSSKHVAEALSITVKKADIKQVKNLGDYITAFSDKLTKKCDEDIKLKKPWYKTTSGFESHKKEIINRKAALEILKKDLQSRLLLEDAFERRDFEAIRTMDFEDIKNFIRNGADLWSDTDFGFKIVELARETEGGIESLFKCSLEANGIKIGSDDLPPIAQAIFRGDGAKVSELCRGGVDPNDEIVRGFTHLAFAIKVAPPHIVKLIINIGVDVNQPNSDGKLPLDIAIDKANPEIIKFLLDKEARLSITVSKEKLEGLGKLDPDMASRVEKLSKQVQQ